jgi:tetratricopeptide (TPR) repeat protein
MRLLQTEYLLKGVYLGLILFAALHLAGVPAGADTVNALLRVNLATLAGLVAALFLASLLRIRESLRLGAKPLTFVFFLLLENPTLAYFGILGGTLGGIYLLREQLGELAHQSQLAPIVGVSAVVGVAFGMLRQVRHRLARMGLIAVLAGGLVAAGLSWLGVATFSFLPIEPLVIDNSRAFAWQLLLAIPFFYLLTFAGHEEESEVEIGVVSAMLGLGLGILLADNRQANSLAFFLPLILYFGYTIKVLPGLRVLKHAFRGFSYLRVGRHRRSLLAFRRALQLDPNNRLAREGFWEVHRSLDLEQLANDPQTLALVDLDLCASRAGTLLLSKPTPVQREEAGRLLDLVVRLSPERQPAVTYWRAVMQTHEGNIPEAATQLTRVLDPDVFGAGNPHRLAVLLSAWQLALTLHPDLRRLVGLPQLSMRGRRMEAIHAVERHLADEPQDAAVINLKKLLYADLTDAEYDAGAGGEGVAAPYVDHAYLQHLGLGLIDDNAHWQRGGEFLRLAARGLPNHSVTLFVQIASAMQRVGRLDDARHNFEMAKRAGHGVGQKNLEDAQRQAYFATVKYLGEDALARGDTDAAIENFRFYSESERAGIETLRTLAELYERRGDPLAAARVTDQALQYNGKDEDLLARKGKYYYSIQPDDLKARLDQFSTGFDVAYCITRARQILERYTDIDWLDVSGHLARLVLVVKPGSLVARVLLARVLLRLGEREQAIALLQETHGPQKPESFASGDDEEAWFQACQLLGDLYLEVGKPDMAVPCLNDFRKSSKSGARTLFKLGQAFEQLGEVPKAKRCYEQVTAYEGNPLAPEAYDALSRLQG